MAELSNPLELSSSDVQEEYIATLSQLEEMGYDCAKLWARFDTLREILEEQEGVELKLEDITSDRRNKEVEATITHTRISELEAKLKKLKAVSKTEREEIETLELTERSQIEEREQILKNIRSAATAPWSCSKDNYTQRYYSQRVRGYMQWKFFTRATNGHTDSLFFTNLLQAVDRGEENIGMI
ncbi:hypothetical protein MKX03_005941 [Papaver bracteatum]|nr:hypothetical protein MKX03_005941 [Papaver bracteatum]